MRIAVVGAGALGLYYGALLQRSGEDVHFLLRSDHEAISERGLKVYSVAGDFSLPRVQGHRLAERIGPVDLVLVGLKTFANPSYAELITPLVAESTLILTLQNGLGNEEALAELFGAGRILGGIALLCANRGRPGEVHHLAAGRIVIGEFMPGDGERIKRLASLFTRAGVECGTTGDLKRTRWEKLVWNIPFNGLCTLLRQPVDRLLGRHDGRNLVRDIMLEVIAAANAQGLPAPIAAEYAESMLTFSDGLGGYRPSMLIDLEQGRRLETESILHIPLRQGRLRGVAMPKSEMLAALLEQATSLPPEENRDGPAV